MHDDTSIKEGIHAAPGAVKQLVGDDEVARRDMFAQAADGADRDYPLDAEALERPDIGTHRYFGGRDTMPTPMTGEKGHRDTLDLANGDHITGVRSEEHTSELQSHLNLVCRLLLEKKKRKQDAIA